MKMMSRMSSYKMTGFTPFTKGIKDKISRAAKTSNIGGNGGGTVVKA